MRVTETNAGLKVHAIAGTYVVVLGFDLRQAQCIGLMGFSVHRQDHTEHTAHYLSGMKCFAETDPGFPAGALYPTNEHPVQGFQWSDYSAKPGHRYTYTVTALKGTPSSLAADETVSIDITTESPAGGDHDIYFNRGLAASQEYARRFGNRRPEAVANGKAFEWLSRGLNEALEDYLTSCIPGTHALRIAAYEFNYMPFLQLVRKTIDRGVDVRIVFDARSESPGEKNLKAVEQAGLESFSDPREIGKSYISHNKFIVRLEHGEPVAVWTGGTNFSEGGIYGHSNVAHVVEQPAVAGKFLDYWQELANDLSNKSLKPNIERISPLPAGRPPAGTTVVFSPRSSLDALSWYAELGLAASEGLLMTFAFGMHDLFKNVYQNSTAPFRIALMEKKTRPMEEGPEREAEEASIQALRNMPENVFAIGSLIKTNQFEGWVAERLSGLNSRVNYVHNKFMLIDPLSDDPIVVAGSANFSDASVQNNDENMLIIRGNTRVADIYLGEFMRLFNHHSFRESLQWRDANAPPRPLRTDDWWTGYFGDTPQSARRKFFARP